MWWPRSNPQGADPKEFKPKRLIESTYGEGFNYIDDKGKTHFVKYNDDFDSQTNGEDVVNQPSHYTYGDIEVIDYIEQVTASYPPELAFLVANIIKYISRAPHKNQLEDIKKSQYYINRLVDKYKEEWYDGTDI